ncbi:MAG: CDP-glycerol glycerophosphotransferase family protein [Clostridia bacterium]|nr:CDP-glycerol glycerophosphotransferase family protein [Clostridia bacterium]
MMMKKWIKTILYKISIKKCIIFESCPDVGDNPKGVFDEMLRRGLNKKYKLVWLLFDNNTDYPSMENVEYVKKGTKEYGKYMRSAKCFICCNRFVYSDISQQKSFFLTHGMYVKNPKAYYKIPKQIDYCLSSSESLKEMQANAISAPLEKMFALGYPRNDILTEQPLELRAYFGKYKKFIVWYPTFRQHNTGMSTGSTHAFPIIWDKENAKRINECAQRNNVLIILKPHFAQDTTKIQMLRLSNIRLIDDTFFKKNNLTSYHFVGSCDAMLTDYSSIYFDYTLCDKPIGLVWEDYAEYERNPGFAFDMEYYMRGGVKIFNTEDFENFIQSVAEGTDQLKKERREIRQLSNYSTDGQSSVRVTDFIIEKANL